jgi:hypothetical protein
MLKHLLHEADARTLEALWQTIGRLLDRFTPIDCATNYIRRPTAKVLHRNLWRHPHVVEQLGALNPEATRGSTADVPPFRLG